MQDIKEQISQMAQAINTYVHSLEVRIHDLEFTNARTTRPPAIPVTPAQRIAFCKLVDGLQVGENVSHPSQSLVAAAKRITRRSGKLFHVKRVGETYTCFRLA